MEVDEVLLECEDQMQSAVDYLNSELKGVRSGRASTALVEYVKVDYYGSSTDLRQLANITVPEATQILIKPFDATSVDAIAKGIQNAGLGLTPINEGKQIRLNLPPLSMDRRQQLADTVKKMGEQAKVAIRNARRDANKAVDTIEKSSSLSEDEARDAKDEVQKLTKDHEGKVEAQVDAKSKELLDV